MSHVHLWSSQAQDDLVQCENAVGRRLSQVEKTPLLLKWRMIVTALF